MDGPDSTQCQRIVAGAAAYSAAFADRGAVLRLSSVGADCSVAAVLDDPVLMDLAAEDVCWLVAVRGWRTRQPPMRRVAARLSWQAEGRRLQQRRRGLVQSAKDAGLPTG
jgi:hypothetical protein